MLRSLDPKERLKVVRSAVDSGDASFVAAVVNGSHLLTGMAEAEQAVCRDMWARTWYGDTMERIARLRKAQGQLDRVTALFGKWAGDILADQSDAVEAAERSAELARAAMAKPSSPPTPASEPNWNTNVADAS